MLKLKTQADLEALISNGERESLTLEFKAGGAIRQDSKGEIGKDVSAMANAAGGQIIYGIKENNHVAAKIAHVDINSFNHEWLENVIQNNTSPPINNFTIDIVPLNTGTNHVAYVVSIPQATATAPHQARVDNKYYRRRNFKAEPMADYEIREAMRRVTDPDLYIYISCRLERSENTSHSSYRLIISPMLVNCSHQPALYTAVTILIQSDIVPYHTKHYHSENAWKPKRFGGMSFHAMSTEMSVPNDFPVFIERARKLPEIQCDYPSHLGNDQFRVGYRVSSPGCSRAAFYQASALNFDIVAQKLLGEGVE
ncbi:ATP-binding protein [Bosea sp. (in: a-proteobacteria)]|uniref:AlbA family DNA-binding domain-containing protein n=1 Tax=Bosea sp. (in: a-proteobacteria) TaxID=1871050 RepID=UPI002B46AB0A|nr:ATP-binding protein [Bosea sp. (in: a-proteobacteria)]WRH59320.1 MAG: ATP-binding protein [Bosea sp. (in: a-proteobacteria)]